MRIAAIATVLFVVLVAGDHGQQSHAQATDIQDAGANSPRPPTTPALGNGASTEQEQSRSEKAEKYLKRAFGPEYLAAWVLVLAAAIGLIATFRTLNILRQQTIAAKESASAALLNAKLAISSQRPWLLIPIGEEGVGVAIRKPFMVPVEQDMGKSLTHCILFIKNHGDTIGRVFASKLELQLGDNPTSPPDANVYEMQHAGHNIVTVPPKESVASQALLASLGFIKAEDQQKVLHGGKYLWLCGFVKYRDTFERENAPEYETRFCYLYENRFNTPEPYWKPAGPSEYNRAT